MKYDLILTIYIPFLLFAIAVIFYFFFDKICFNDRDSVSPSVFLVVIGFLINQIAKLQNIIAYNEVKDKWTLYGNLLIILCYVFFLFFIYRKCWKSTR